jgi:thiosulfate/3-mercaptopyruvate sulfurtransferase
VLAGFVACRLSGATPALCSGRIEEILMRMRYLAFSALFFLTLAGAAPPAPRAAMLVSSGWLAQHLSQPNLVILHVGPEQSYAQHIPGARYVTGNGLSTPMREGQNMLELPNAVELRAELARLGISDNSRIVVAFDQEWVTPATRLVFTLGAAGFGNRVSLLDGGMETWRREHRPLTAEATPQRAGRLSPLHIQPWVADAAFVRAHAGRPGYALIDARAPAYYDGIQVGGSHGHPHERGHIPGARNIPFTTLINGAMMVRPAAELATAFRQAGVRPGDTVIVYCHIGQQGTAILFAARSLGYRALLYDGSFEDWSRRGLPVEASAHR